MSKETNSRAKAEFEQSADAHVLSVGGIWRLTEPSPPVEEVMPKELKDSNIKVVPKDLAEWDSSLPLFLLRLRAWCNSHGIKMSVAELPDKVKRLLELISESEEKAASIKMRPRPTPTAAQILKLTISKCKRAVQFVGECLIGGIEVPTRPRQFHWKTFFYQMVETGPKAFPIIGLISFLVGLTFAYETSIQLRRFGLQFYMIGATGTSILREIGPLIAAILLAGRTGAAFAANIANMKLGNEIAALEIIGVSPVSFLVLPRVAALLLTMPLTAVYSDVAGMMGPLIISVFKLNVPVSGFLVQMSHDVTLTDFFVGLVKSFVFGVIIALAGTWNGMQSERSSAGLGRAVTSAVVTGIACILAMDALFSPILENLGF